MRGLLDTATVIEGDGHWTTGYEIDALACGRDIKSLDICTFDPPDESTDSASGYRIEPWALVGTQRFPIRCAPGDASEELVEALENATEYEVAHNFWYGDVDSWRGATGGEGIFLSASNVATVARGTTTAATIAAVLEEAYKRNPDIQPIIHLGMLAALELVENKLNELGYEYAVSPGYPVNAIAVTGPVLVRLGTIESEQSVHTQNNRLYTAGTRLAAVEFDPCYAVRALSTP